ncbi:MAG: HAMP domain-containing histidine kinase [Myxococcota bacterium]|nr:HAMP domain-containing histidine kinase [Myxococcota bacterium]
MRHPRAAALIVAALGLAGALAVLLVLHRSAAASVERALEERLMAAGRTAALLLESGPATFEQLAALREANALEGAYVVDGALTVEADALGAPPHPADLLRVDADRVALALTGTPSVSASYGIGEVTVLTGYFPLREDRVLALEAGDAFAQARAGPTRALLVGLLLALVTAAALGAVAVFWARLEGARREVEARAARAEVVSRMAAIAAHEIRNPLAVIRGTVELVDARHRDALPEGVPASLQDVLSEVQRMAQLTDDLLDLSADRALHSAPLDLGPLVEETVRAVRSAHPGVGIRLQSSADPLEVEGDPARLRQVLGNLLENAVQAQGEAEIQVRLERRGAQAAVEVRDQGPGVPPELQERIFEPFFTTRTQGTGLGLALSRRLVERHRGQLTLIPTERGTAFLLTLPLRTQ